MKTLENIQNYFFIGVGGIGMSALARYVKQLGKQVAGYDKTETSLTQKLVREGISLIYKDSVSEIDAIFLDHSNTLVVYTPAIPKDHTLLNFFEKKQFTIMKRAGLLGEVTKNTFCLAVAGTHGKTTTSAILGHLLAACDMPVTAFLGGIAENYQSNFISNGTKITVVEADEFDRSFLTLNPDVACITSMDADHLDIYEETSALEASFQQFASLVPNVENLFYKNGLPLEGNSVAVGQAADVSAQNIRIENGSYVFDLVTTDVQLKNLKFHLPGHHNVSNAVMALAMAMKVEAPLDKLPAALSSFKGVDRRFSYKIKRDDIVLIDDYAHHPTELDALHQAVSEMYPDDQKLIVFQPHLFSRTQDFATNFAKSLSKFDEILLLEIYPARELPVKGVNSSWLLDKISNQNKALVTKTALPKQVSQSSCKVKLIVGAGDIGAEVTKIMEYIANES